HRDGNRRRRDDDQRNQRRQRQRDRNRSRDRRDDHEQDDRHEGSEDETLIPISGILDVLDNYAFVRTSGYLPGPNDVYVRSEEHTSELQSRFDLVCRLLLEKKKSSTGKHDTDD